ncbi:MAG: hypothetical protein JXR36_15795 [Bacteroidales bacterium]|nr:hypothetical protein [Bacteroidales bacterium]
MYLNFFNITCFIAAGLALISSLVRFVLPEILNSFEQKLIETEEKPFWVFALGVFSIMFIVIVWFHVWRANIQYSWIMASLISISLIKSCMFVFNYDKFRQFAAKFIGNNKRMLVLNLLVLSYGLVLLVMGLFLY